ncbi:carboxypeptidase-like regulatory domain-containing protein [Flagellimonas alvinocaridis]|uniref:Carboxypeptidase-like regulatory domain-containing protein n=1 Tax=Flagellimonas alvinocaridis TaxID=2530200 RepID=A0A4S8RM93_9FLAO|nr:carboxypeptidase-like regulatory domain-containing protein [Allomuricauda alvinocaridis]THV58771.1 carboxypeptidase-like regulatory domain-containing protein [Allomuricauda alvinocaridis]
MGTKRAIRCFFKEKLVKGTLFLVLIALQWNPSKVLAFQENVDTTVDFNQYQGEVVDESTNNPLVFATLAVEGTNISTITNTEGGFLLKVPKNITDGNVIVSFLGYKNKTIPLSSLQPEKNRISLSVSITELSEININVPKDAAALVKETLARKGDNYFSDPTLMTAFYRETIRKRRKNVSLSEAVVSIYKSPYNSARNDALELYKARKSTDYSKLDTVALKLQGGPFNTLYVDIMKYPEFLFGEGSLSDYTFSFGRSTRINDRLIYVIKFNQRETVTAPLYNGELFIDVENKTLTSAVYSLNITDKDLASQLFVRRKPMGVDVWPTEVAYRVDYREKGGKWYYGYSSVMLEFKIDWEDRLFNSVYSMTAEMAVTDWERNESGQLPKNRERIKKSIILSDEAIGFSDPDFWGEYNIIEPERSIESAIKKIQRQLRRIERRSK